MSESVSPCTSVEPKCLAAMDHRAAMGHQVWPGLEELEELDLRGLVADLQGTPRSTDELLEKEGREKEGKEKEENVGEMEGKRRMKELKRTW